MTTRPPAANQSVVDVVEAPVRLAPGVELLGEYTDAGLSRPQYLLRRPDGRVILLSRLLYLVAAALVDHDRPGAVARVVGEQLGRPVTAADVDDLIATQLRPAGVLTTPDSQSVSGLGRNPLLRPPLSAGAVPDRLHRALTSALRPLFHVAVVVNVVAVMALVDLWVVSHRRVLLDAWVHVASRPTLVLVVGGLMVTSLAFHEIGHATACRHGGGCSSGMGVRVHRWWPAFYADVTDAHRLDRRGRLRTDLGGIYFDIVFAVTAAGGYAATGYEPFLAVLVLAQIRALYQLLPFVRLDGYHALGDLVGDPNLSARLRDAATTLLPGRAAARRQAHLTLAALTRPARIAVRAWLALTVPILAVTIAVAAYLAPKAVPVLWRSARADADKLADAVGSGQWLSATNLGLQLSLLTVLVLGWAVLVARAGHVVGRSLAARATNALVPTRSPGGPRRMAVPVVALTAILLVAAVGLAIGRLNAPDPAAAPPTLSAATTTPPTQAAPQPTGPDPGSVTPPAPTAEGAPAAAGPFSGGQDGPAARPPGPPATALVPSSGPSAPAPTPAPPATTPVTAPVAAAPVATTTTTPTTWIVRPGEDLWTIARQVQATVTGRQPDEAEITRYWAQVVEANRATVAQPDVLRAGQTLTLPEPSTTPPAAGGTTPAASADTRAASATTSATTWIVHPDEHLWSIAHHSQARALGRAPTETETATYWAALLDANRPNLSDPDLLHPGQTVHLPGPVAQP